MRRRLTQQHTFRHKDIHHYAAAYISPCTDGYNGSRAADILYTNIAGQQQVICILVLLSSQIAWPENKKLWAKSAPRMHIAISVLICMIDS
eukprot:scaffold72768_cov16-Prasinocladus_malaysianus.AAC.1